MSFRLDIEFVPDDRCPNFIEFLLKNALSKKRHPVDSAVYSKSATIHLVGVSLKHTGNFQI